MAREHHHPDRDGGHARPFDIESDEVTEQFWGRTRGWASRPEQRHDAADRTAELDRIGDDIWAERTGSLRAVPRDDSDRVAARRAAAARRGGIDRTRSHGIVRPGAPRPDDRTDRLAATVPGSFRHDARSARDEATLAQLAAGAEHRDARASDDWDDPAGDWDAELVLDERRGSRRGVAPLAQRLGLGAVDPLLLRIGVLVITGALALPFAIGLRDDDGGPATADTPVAAAAGATPTVTAPVVVAVPSATSPASPTPVPTAAPASEPDPTTAGADDDDDQGAPAGDVGESAPAAGASDESEAGAGDADTADANDAGSGGANDEAATVTATAQRLEPECALEYEAAPGDSWYRIADAAGITPDELLDANLADVDAPIFPGDEICLPAGATMPTPPTTSTTVAPSTTAPSTTAPTTTAPPSTSAPASTTEVQRLIREIWPDELEEKALDVAWRESNYRATAFNGTCCHGVFQIHWTAHRSWLDDFGITSTSDLYDARKNITAAYALYQRAGGWGPWGG